MPQNNIPEQKQPKVDFIGTVQAAYQNINGDESKLLPEVYQLKAEYKDLPMKMEESFEEF